MAAEWTPSPLVGEGWGGGSCRGAPKCHISRPPPPTPPQPNLAIVRVRPLNKVIEVGNSRLRLGGEEFVAMSSLNLTPMRVAPTPHESTGITSHHSDAFRLG